MGSLFPVPGRPRGRRTRALSRKELLALERSKKKVDALLLAFNAWMVDREGRPLGKTTRNQYTYLVRRAMKIAEAGGHSILAGDVRDVRFVLGMLPPHPSSQAGYIAALAAFYDFLVEATFRKDNPTEKIRRPPLPIGVPRPLSYDDCCSYLRAAFRLSITHYAIAVLGLYMGLRRNEIRDMKWSQFFEFDDRLWCDVHGKGGFRDAEPVHHEVAAVLLELRKQHDDPIHLFPSTVRARYGHPVSKSWIRTRHLEIVEDAGLGPCTLHQLRHSFATHMGRAGSDISVVQRAMRHRAISSTQIYRAVFDDELAAGIDQLDFRWKAEEPEAELVEVVEVVEEEEEETDGEDTGPSSEAG